MSEIEPQMLSKIIQANTLDEQTLEDKIKHKVEYKQVPFIDLKKSMIILSNGDPIKLAEGVFQRRFD